MQTMSEVFKFEARLQGQYRQRVGEGEGDCLHQRQATRQFVGAREADFCVESNSILADTKANLGDLGKATKRPSLVRGIHSAAECEGFVMSLKFECGWLKVEGGERGVNPMSS
jgi:hypothetical protein